jgi:hypothetical protein
MHSKLTAVCALVVLLLLAGCAPSKGPLMMVQMCLSNERDVGEFVDELKLISTGEKMEFVDNSRNAEQELKHLNYAGRDRSDGSRLIDIRVIRNDGMSIGATNLGLPGYQMVMGFSEGSDATESREFANRTLLRIKKRWSVRPVPAGTGAQPLADCS